MYVYLRFRSFNLNFRYMATRKQTDIQTDIHMYLCNAVTLVWGSLMLAPIRTKYTDQYIHIKVEEDTMEANQKRNKNTTIVQACFLTKL